MARTSKIRSLPQILANVNDALGTGSALGRIESSVEARKGMVQIEKAIEDAAKREAGELLDSALTDLGFIVESNVSGFAFDVNGFADGEATRFPTVAVFSASKSGTALQFVATRHRIVEGSTINGTTTEDVWATYLYEVDGSNGFDTTDPKCRLKSTVAASRIRVRFEPADASTIVKDSSLRKTIVSRNPIETIQDNVEGGRVTGTTTATA